MSYTKLIFHIVFRTKSSTPAITIEHDKLLYAYMTGVLRNHNCHVFNIGGMQDHIHILTQIPPSESIPTLMRDLKTSSNSFLKQHKDKFPLFDGWGKAYFAITVSPSQIHNVFEYIDNQKSHHLKYSFREEIENYYNKAELEYDPKYFLND